MSFNNNSDIEVISKGLQQKLSEIGELSLANKLYVWDRSFFTTSSEFLGEIKIILEEVYDLRYLDNEVKQDIRECLSAINNALIDDFTCSGIYRSYS